MSTIADYSVFTKAFLATSEAVDFSKLYIKPDFNPENRKAFAVIPLKRDPSFTPLEAMNLTLESIQVGGRLSNKVSCQDADGKLIGNVVRIQPSNRDGSIRLVAKVAVPVVASSEGGEVDTTDALYNTFVLVYTNPTAKVGIPIAVATISKGYNLHRHLASGNDPLDAVENANYVSFTINNLNGYTSVDFNPDAYVTYDVTDALSRRVDVLEGKEGIEGLHIAFNSNTGDIILSDSKGNVIDQVNLHIDSDTIIADGEEGYKYVKTDVKQDIHSAKAFMPSGTSAFGEVGVVPYDTKHASLLRYEDNATHEVYNGIRVRWSEQAQEGSQQATEHDEVFCVRLVNGNGSEGISADKKYLAWGCYTITKGQEGQDDVWEALDPKFIKTASGTPIEVTGASAIYSGEIAPTFIGIEPVYDHDVFVHTVGNSSLADWDECFKLMGFHDGDDIPLGTMLPALMEAASGKPDPDYPDQQNVYLDPEAWIHGENADNASNVKTQRKFAKAEMVEYNKRRPALAEDRSNGTIIDSSGLDIRNGIITLGCGRDVTAGEGGVTPVQKVNYGIQMESQSESLDFTISQTTGKEVMFNENGHAVGLTSSTLLSIQSGSYISGAPTCLILAEVKHNPSPEGGPTLFTPVRMTAGFSVAQSEDESNRGLRLTIHDDRKNISALFNPNGGPTTAPAIIEVQAIYTHTAAETVPAQQMHTYIGTWNYNGRPACTFLCNKIEEWMMAVGLSDQDTSGGVKLYVVIRVY